MLIATTNAGGAGKWEPSFSRYFSGRQVVILPDNDDAGEKHAEDVKAKLAKVCASIAICKLPGLPPKGDVSDWLSTGGTAEELEHLARRPDQDDEAKPSECGSEKFSGKLTVLRPAECEHGDPLPYIWKGFAARGDHVEIIGPPGSGKSTLAPMVGYSFALGIPFLGRRVRQGLVLYFAAEDGHGMKLRVRALRQRLGDTPDFLLVPDPIDLLNAESGDLERVLGLIRLHKPVAVFIDTIARAFPGLRENDADSMSRVVTVVRTLTAEESRPAVVTVHHVAKDQGSTPRGHGVLAGDLDVILLIQGEKAEQRSVTLTKNRNGTSDCTFGFHIEAEDFGEDEDGDLITAPIAAPVEVPTASRKAEAEAKLNDKATLLLREIRDLIARHGEMRSPGESYPTVLCVTRTLLRSRLVDRGWFAENLLCVGDDGKMRLDRSGYPVENNGLNALKRREIVGANRLLVWLI